VESYKNPQTKYRVKTPYFKKVGRNKEKVGNMGLAI
jgi:hypothetical protein